MIAVEYDRYGGPDVIELRERPEPMAKSGEVQLRVRAAALNPKDALVRAGKFKRLAGPRFPKRMGYDFVGEVMQDAAGFKAGTRVFGMINSWQAGAFAQTLALPADELAPMPANLEFAEAAALPLAAQTALQALRDLARIKPGSRVVIHGASGGVGTLAVQIAKALGAEVTALCGASSFDLLHSLGADQVIDYRATAPDSLEGRFDAFFDVFGNQHFGSVSHLLTRRGCYVTTVPNARNIRDDVLRRFSPFKRARLVIVRSRRRDLEVLAKWVENGKLKPLIAERLPLAEVRRAHELIQTRRTHGKIVLDIP